MSSNVSTPVVLPGPSSGLFNVQQFQKLFTLFNQEDVDQDLTDPPVDLSIDDVKVATQFEKIEQQISNELRGISTELEETRYSNMVEMIKNAELNLVSLRDSQTNEAQKPKKNKKEVNYITAQQLQEAEKSVPFAPAEDNEVILSVSLYHPTKLAKVQEYLVLGSQPLTVLRDKFYCLSDHILDGPAIKSGYFFIENTFYNDMRDSDAVDYSQYIINWTNEKNRFTHPELGIFSSKSMTDTCFKDLSIRIGAQYLYVHQGNCEHILTFTDLRMMHDQDNKNKNAYPIHTFQNKIRRKKCQICDIYPAKFVTYGDKLAPENPCYYCDNCYRPLHYTFEGKLLYEDFEVYPYYHD